MHPCPVDRRGVPCPGVHILEGIAPNLVLDSGRAFQPVEDRYKHAAGGGQIRLEGIGAGAGHEAVFVDILHRVVVPGVVRHIHEGIAPLALGYEGHIYTHLTVRHGERIGVVVFAGDFNRVAVLVGDCDFAHLIALVGLGGDCYALARFGLLRRDHYDAVFCIFRGRNGVTGTGAAAG